MIAVIITAIPGIIAGLFNRWIFIALLFAIIPIIYLVNRFFVIIKWNLVEGIIEDVTLVNDFNQPYTEAHIIFKTKDNMEHECRFTIGHYGDYEEGIEPELENMLQSDKELFMKKCLILTSCLNFVKAFSSIDYKEIWKKKTFYMIYSFEYIEVQKR